MSRLERDHMALAHAIDPVADAPVTTTVLFPAGLVGFPRWRRFQVVEDPETPEFALLQCLDEPSVSLLVAAVEPLVPSYLDHLGPGDQAALAALGVGARPDIDLYCTLTVHESSEVTANLAGPLVIDREAGCGTQVVLTDSTWPVRYPLGTVTE
jgi:flagellar assembly factor FliW